MTFHIFPALPSIGVKFNLFIGWEKELDIAIENHILIKIIITQVFKSIQNSNTDSVCCVDTVLALGNTERFFSYIFSLNEMICHLIRSSRKLLLGKTRLLYASERIFSLNRKFSIDKINNEMEKIIAIGQMCATNNKIANRQQVQEIVNSAVEQNACVRYLLFIRT